MFSHLCSQLNARTLDKKQKQKQTACAECLVKKKSHETQEATVGAISSVVVPEVLASNGGRGDRRLSNLVLVKGLVMIQQRMSHPGSFSKQRVDSAIYRAWFGTTGNIPSTQFQFSSCTSFVEILMLMMLMVESLVVVVVTEITLVLKAQMEGFFFPQVGSFETSDSVWTIDNAKSKFCEKTLLVGVDLVFLSPLHFIRP